MKVIGRDIGPALDSLYGQIQARVAAADRDLQVEPFEGDALSSVRWTPKAATIYLHTGVPTHALPHVFGVALQHVRQTLDAYPEVRRPQGKRKQPEGADLVRGALRELVLEPDAEVQLGSLGLDREWENEQRHQAMKDLLREPPEDWNEPGSMGNAFAALQYARLAVQHPPQMFEALRKRMEEALPLAAERGEAAGRVLRRRRWGNAGACVESLVNVRNELELGDVAAIEDRRTGQLL